MNSDRYICKNECPNSNICISTELTSVHQTVKKKP